MTFWRSYSEPVPVITRLGLLTSNPRQPTWAHGPSSFSRGYELKDTNHVLKKFAIQLRTEELSLRTVQIQGLAKGDQWELEWWEGFLERVALEV